MRWLRAVVLIVLIGAASNIFAQGVSEGPGRVEELLGLTSTPEGITFQVRTGGCTRPENFKIQRFGGRPTQILLIRTVPDFCEALVPFGTTFTVSYSQLRLNPGEGFVVLNPLATAYAGLP